MFKNPKIEALLQYGLFTVLVVLTPFIVVTRYSQRLAHIVSHLGFELWSVKIPVILLISLAGVVFCLVWQRKNLDRGRVSAIFIILFLIFIAHRTMDIYLALSFFDLQINWHYVAYCAYAFFFFRAFFSPKIPLIRLIIIAYFSAVMMSLFDETFQLFMSDRVFDISDISKDALGVYIGLITILFITRTYGSITVSLKSQSFMVMIMLGLFTMSFIFISPLLTEYEYLLSGILLSLGLFVLLTLFIYLCRFRLFRIISSISFVVLLISTTTVLVINWERDLIFKKPGLILYKGIPLPYFDFIVFSNSYCHFIDKKKYFRSTDKDFLLRKQPDIVLIGSGVDGSGGQGFDQGLGTHFVFNKYTAKGTQVIIIPTPIACEKYNHLKKIGKKVMMVVHNE
jgi:hypothetical protein